MKKLLAITLAFVLVLSLSAVAFAAASPTKDVTTDDLPGQSTAVSGATVQTAIPIPAKAKNDVKVPDESEAVKDAEVVSGTATVVPIKDMTAAQKAETNKAISAVVKEGALPVDAFAVDTEDEAVVTVELDKNAVVYVFFADGKVMKYAAKDLTVREDGTYEIPVKGFSYIVIAVEG